MIISCFFDIIFVDSFLFFDFVFVNRFNHTCIINSIQGAVVIVPQMASIDGPYGLSDSMP